MKPVMPVLTVAIRRERDVLTARQRARQIGQFLGFSVGDTTRITTALSEIARNALEYGGGGTVTFTVQQLSPARQELVMRVEDTGAGIADVAAVMSPEYRSRTGMGIGISGSCALMDRLDVTSAAGAGTCVVMAKALPWATRFAAAEASQLSVALAKSHDETPLGELQLQNQLLLASIERAEAAQLVAERSLVVRERFMALTTHELRTPLNAIMGYLDLLDLDLAASLSEKQQLYFDRARRATRQLLGLTNDFLDMAQGDAGRLRIERHAGAARHVMAEAASLVAPQAALRDVELRLAETSDRVMYLGDSDRVRQVLVNLLGNAVSFTPAGGVVEITAASSHEPPPGDRSGDGPWCAIRVADTGPGIPSEKLAHVFEPFVQLSSNGQASRKGSGLGLTVSRQLAVLMGGDLTASSTPAGATFTLWLAQGANAHPSTGGGG